MEKPGWMTEERARRIREKAEEATAEEMRRLHESGEIAHLYGRPLELDDDPEWLVAKVLKQQGFSHPLLEAARELEEPRQRAEDTLQRLRRRHRWLSAPKSRCTPEQAASFNAYREQSLQEYRVRLEALNRAIRDYNLTAPEALHQVPVRIDRTVEQAAAEIPRIDAPAQPARRRRFFRR
jgi:hypothetical protein